MRNSRRYVWHYSGFLFLLFFMYMVPASFAQQAVVSESSLERMDQFLIKKMKVESGKSEVQIYQELGLVYFRQEDFNRSFMYFNKAVALDPKAWWAWYYLGLLNMEDPVDYFKKSIKANSRFAPPYYWLGRYYCKKKNTRESLKYFNDYLRISKDNPEEMTRMRIAEQFIKLIKGGDVDYDSILRKIEIY